MIQLTESDVISVMDLAAVDYGEAIIFISRKYGVNTEQALKAVEAVVPLPKRDFDLPVVTGPRPLEDEERYDEQFYGNSR